jgi:hypothetical protein
MDWEIEPHTDQIPPAIAAALAVGTAQRDAKPTTVPPPIKSWRSHWAFRGHHPWLWGPSAAGVAAILILLLALPQRSFHSTAPYAEPAPAPASQPLAMQESISAPATPSIQDKISALSEAHMATQFAPHAAPPLQQQSAPTAPMIARTAELTLTAANLDRARTRLDEILHQHRGYLGDLNVASPSEGGRSLTASLRVPADQLDPTLTALKTLGRIESESQSGEEVTAQYVDLSARLQNARNTETRLTDLLRERTGKLSDVLEVETELSRVRGEIEQMEADKKLLETRVAFSTIKITINEEFKARAQVVPNSTGTRFRNAAIDGYQTAVNGLVAVLLFFISSGPTLLVWAAILFLPVRYLWRKNPWRQTPRPNPEID